MALPLLAGKFRAFSAAGIPLNGGKLESYQAASGTPQATYTNNSLTVANPNPVILDANGEADIWVNPSLAYKFILKDSLGNIQWTEDNFTLGGSGSGTSSSEWNQFSGVPTFISATSFSVVGDQRATFEVGRRLKSANTAGTVYSTIVSSVFGAVTTVTIVNDSGVLDAGLSVVNYSVLDATIRSLPFNTALNIVMAPGANIITATQYTLGGAGAFATSATSGDTLSEMAAGVFTAKMAGSYLINVTCSYIRSGATLTNSGGLLPYINGNPFSAVVNLGKFSPPDANDSCNASMSCVVNLAAGDLLTTRTSPAVQFSAGGPPNSVTGFLSIVRVR